MYLDKVMYLCYIDGDHAKYQTYSNQTFQESQKTFFKKNAKCRSIQTSKVDQTKCRTYKEAYNNLKICIYRNTIYNLPIRKCSISASI